MKGFLTSKGFQQGKGLQQGKGFLHPVKGFQLGAGLNLPTGNLVQLFDGTLAADGLSYVDKSSFEKNLNIVRNSCYLLQSSKTTTYPTQVNFDSDIVTIEAWYKRTGTANNCYVGKFATKGIYLYFQNSNVAGRMAYRVFGSVANTAANADTGVLLPANTWTKVKFVVQAGVEQGIKIYLDGSETPSFAGCDLRSLGTINYDTKFVMGGAGDSICDLKIKRGSLYDLYAPCAEGFGLTSYDISGNGNHGVHTLVTISNRNTNSNYQDVYNFNNSADIDVYQSSTYVYAGNIIVKPKLDLNGNAIAYVDRETALYGAYSLLYSTDTSVKGIHKSDSLYKLTASTENIASDYQNFWFDAGGVAIPRTWEEINGLGYKWFADKNTPYVIKKLVGYSTVQDDISTTKINAYLTNKPIELWIQAGESLAAASQTLLSALDPSVLGDTYYAKVFDGTNFKVVNTNRSTHCYPSTSVNTYYSTLFPLSQLRATKGRECWFVHLGVGSSRIYQDPAQAFNWNVNTVGGSYSILKTLITNAIAYLEKYNIPYIFKGVIWQQGANDAGATYTPTFKQNTINLINGLRSHIGADIPFYVGQTANYNADAASVRADQEAICTELESCVFIEDTGMTYTDGVHLGVSGKQLFAERVNDRAIAGANLN